MNIYMRAAIAAVLVIGVGLVAINVIPRGSEEAGVGGLPTSSPSPSASAAPSAGIPELTQTFVDLLQPRRAIFEHPVERIADGCRTFLQQATLNPTWGGLVARYAWSFPTVGSAARGLLAEDLREAARRGLITEISPDLGSAIVVGIVLQVMLSASEGNVRSPDVPSAVTAILQSLGVSRREAHAIVRRVTSS